jgi:translation initiation factor 3 subunit H
VLFNKWLVGAAAQVAMYHKNLARQQQQQAAWLVKRRQENAARRAAGGWKGGVMARGLKLHGACFKNYPQSTLSSNRVSTAGVAAGAGEEPLPEEDPTFRPIPEPPMLDSFLVTNQIAHYCEHISAAAERGVASLYLMQGLQQAVSSR